MATITSEQDVLALSARKWDWMSQRDLRELTAVFHSEAVFVHMGGAWGTEQELAIIETGRIHYKHADVHEVTASVVGTTAVVLSRLTLLAVVGGNEVTNLFEVTETYAYEDGRWKLLALAFTKLLAPQDQPPA
jgi:putative intracellular protease/amidase